MAKVEYAFPVEKIHGKVGKAHKIGFSYRKASKRNFTVAYGERVAPIKPGEITQRQKFSAVMANTMARLKNVEYIAQDMAAFSAQSKYTTLRGYVFKQEWEKYNAE